MIFFIIKSGNKTTPKITPQCSEENLLKEGVKSEALSSAPKRLSKDAKLGNKFWLVNKINNLWLTW